MSLLLSHFSCVWLFRDLMDCSPPGSSVHGILQAIILEWDPLLQGIFPIQGSNSSLLHCRQILHHLSHHVSFEPKLAGLGEWICNSSGKQKNIMFYTHTHGFVSSSVIDSVPNVFPPQSLLLLRMLMRLKSRHQQGCTPSEGFWGESTLVTSSLQTLPLWSHCLLFYVC